jgi:molybdate transport system regulatory protein
MAGPVVRFRIDFAERSSVGPAKIALLKAIRVSGSLSQAARNLDMSYRHAWLLVDDLNSSFREPVTVTITGGKGGRSVRVTEFGEMLIENYCKLEQDIAALALRRLYAIMPIVVRHCASDAKSQRRPNVYKRSEILSLTR